MVLRRRLWKNPLLTAEKTNNENVKGTGQKNRPLGFKQTVGVCLNINYRRNKHVL